MLPLAIETSNLTRSFGGRAAVDCVSLAVPRGCVYGFLGPNGAGKTTTIRLLLGLLTPTSGEIRLNGEPFTRDRRSLLRNIGSLVETPSVYPNLTGRENLEVTRLLLGVAVSRIDEVLAQFDLTTDADRQAGAYSTGMRQSLGLAAAWLGQPDLLILDEPASGLDPAATRKLRSLLRRTADEGATVFVSSHALSEIDQLAPQPSCC
jgi:lantibiotic transport system ATP-binding protein